MNSEEFKKNYRTIVERIFNNWQNLRLAVEHGMGGRNGQKIAIDVMNYTYEYCIGNDKITQVELQDIIEELMDQEFNTICEDGSVSEICRHLLRYKEMSLQNKYDDIEQELSKLPRAEEWLRPNVKSVPIVDDTSSEESGDSTASENELMEVEYDDKQSQRDKHSDDGWTTVSRRK